MWIYVFRMFKNVFSDEYDAIIGCFVHTGIRLMANFVSNHIIYFYETTD